MCRSPALVSMIPALEGVGTEGMVGCGELCGLNRGGDLRSGFREVEQGNAQSYVIVLTETLREIVAVVVNPA